ncbi:MAG: YihA family ribosome biogenesis GTP-binding protein [Saprospiraceae bacterium]|jgi:GTP-binding protein|nr:YihA family ribosome biogenesis GTP-binding protein [Saprospiraceae bacterium]MBK6481501.1 YihA family ribosome biogenesis GTP-binding protein [Saprospiraceae bacterium]MBK6815968.1 YihA family ribosome biogenesis GTP-binding protein [Saprospiraceae bacterium]MBK7370577.1 YihA family ribosome biogenesis GTP-binding protein [Saprospiraceae bacterium]MBK7438728.1 YihA family ribosome biogenesis GTP-binding protein [Saprospiraceae bacterium]
MMKSKSSKAHHWIATYVGSYVDASQLPADQRPTVAVIGRSNVGKSSFINALCNQKGLARISANPGKTQTLNYYIVDQQFYLVDMPGYGFAKVSKELRGKWTDMTNKFLSGCDNLVSVIILVDANISPQDLDLEFINWCGEQGIPFVIVRTKCDRTKPLKLQALEDEFSQKLLESWEELPPILRHSAVKLTGNQEVRSLIEDMCK